MKKFKKTKEVQTVEAAPTQMPVQEEVAVENSLLNLEQGVKNSRQKKVKGGCLNVRECPNGKIVGVLNNGTEVKILCEVDNWAQIGPARWVCLDYLE